MINAINAINDVAMKRILVKWFAADLAAPINVFGVGFVVGKEQFSALGPMEKAVPD